MLYVDLVVPASYMLIHYHISKMECVTGLMYGGTRREEEGSKRGRIPPPALSLPPQEK